MRKMENSTIFRILVLVIFVVSACMADDNELKDYCSLHKFENSVGQGGLRFTKEVVTSDYANQGSFKAIHCCLRGYRSIEWYKDNRPYPWPEGHSQFILYPESANQTIYTSGVKPFDAGSYSCRAHNDTATLEGNITFIVLGEPSNGYSGRPLITYRPTSQLVPLGETARLFCESYIGRAYVPDARNSVTWWKANSNNSLESHGKILQHRVSRDSDQIVGSYLVIEDVTLDDYGEYTCRISNGVDDEVLLVAHLYHQEPGFYLGLNNRSWQKSLLLTLILIVLLLTAILFYARCWLPVAVCCRDKFASLEENDGKNSDALVCYHEKDSSLVFGSVVPILESRYRYKCTSLEISNMSQNWHLEIAPHAASARRVIVILSPDALSNGWTEQGLQKALEQLSYLENSAIALALRDPPPPFSAFVVQQGKKKQPETVDVGKTCRQSHEFVSTSGVKVLRWLGPEVRDFWWRLRLAMPPMRPQSATDGCRGVAMIVHSSVKAGQQKVRSRESMEVLV